MVSRDKGAVRVFPIHPAIPPAIMFFSANAIYWDAVWLLWKFWIVSFDNEPAGIDDPVVFKSATSLLLFDILFEVQQLATTNQINAIDEYTYIEYGGFSDWNVIIFVR